MRSSASLRSWACTQPHTPEPLLRLAMLMRSSGSA
jgi:hypothetical protein